MNECDPNGGDIRVISKLGIDVSTVGLAECIDGGSGRRLRTLCFTAYYFNQQHAFLIALAS